jgi:hypothetical protein
MARLFFLKIGFTVRVLKNYSTFAPSLSKMTCLRIQYIMLCRCGFSLRFVKKRNKLKHNSETNMYTVQYLQGVKGSFLKL